jgi:putative membrane protein
MAYAVAAYLHFVAIFLLFALLVLEHQLFSQPLSLERARSLFRTDIAFGIVAGLVLITGAARAMRYGKGMDYYLNNSFFHAKIGVFVAVALLSIYPTVTFLRWRPALKAGQPPAISPATTRWVKLIIRVELLTLLLIPLLATLMARGFGVIAQ